MRPAPWASASIALLVAACGQTDQAASPAAPTPAPAAPVATDFNRPINLVGTEPFWAVQIRADGLTFSAPDHEDTTASNPGPTVRGNEAVWTGDALGQPLRATVTEAACQDGMSDLTYPFSAEVEFEGRVLQGCGGYADAMPREAAAAP
jgi:uncharacterized membrane protein